MKNNYEILISKLDEFIRKYYRNRLIKGFLYVIAALVAFYLIAIITEYFAYFNTSIRTVLFYSYIVVNAIVIGKYILIPLASLYRIGQVISHEQAADIIGVHFENVKDKLLNTLQLKDLANMNPSGQLLIEASINQKIDELKPVPFKTAIDIKKNRKYLKYAAVPVVAGLILLVAAPSTITEPTVRIINHQDYYEKPLPFTIQVLNNEMKTIQQEDFMLEVKVVGDKVPENVFIEYDNGRYRLQKKSLVDYNFRFKNVLKDTRFRLVSDKYRSKEYEIIVIPKPIILNFEAAADYPAYTRKKDEIFNNRGDLIVPVGTTIEWSIYTRDTRKVMLNMAGEKITLKDTETNTFRHSKRMFGNMTYTVKTANEYLSELDSLKYSITVIPDQFPDILVEQYQDSIYEKRLYFKGIIKDDYGFNHLAFVIEGNPDSGSSLLRDTVVIINQGTEEQFFHFYDLAYLNIKPGEEYTYYFEIWDNDGVYGSKSTRSNKMYFKAPTLEELEDMTDKSNEMIKSDMASLMKEAESLRLDIEDIRKDFLNKPSLNWEDKKKLEDLVEKHESLEEKLQKVKEENKIKSEKEQQYKEISEELLRKQEELEKLFDELFTDEMKKMMEELQKMMEELNKDKINQMMEKMEMSTEELEKELDRSLELYKYLEFEKQMEETIDKMEKLAAEQEKLAEETENKEKDDAELLKKQEELNKKFDDLAKELDELEKKNKELEEPYDMMDTQSDEDAIKEDMQESSDQLGKGKNKKASASQKSAAQKMKQMGQKLGDMMNEMQMQAMGEDINTLRAILENLIEVSFRQEDLMEKVNQTKTADPQYLKRIQAQNNLKDDIKLIEDSLFALSKRQTRIKSIINKETEEINRNMTKSIESLNNRNKREAITRQQFIMTGINNLALLLAESLQQMQNDMNSMSQGKGSCNNPGGKGKGSMKSMRKMQEQLNKQMEQMKKGMQQGKGKPGKSGPGMSEQVARMAAQQEAIRRELEQYREQLNKEGLGKDAGLKKMIEEMEETETDLVNKRITEEMIKRQEEILTRLLESEKAEREREKEETRESKEAKNYEISNPNGFLEYKRVKSRELELLKTVPPSLKPYYKGKVNAYFYNFGEAK